MLKSRNMDDVVYRRAAARVDAQLAFYRHVIIYVVANLLLAVLNLVRNRHHLWFHWVIFGWGIGLLVHALNVYAYRWFASRREQMIQRESERQQRLRESPPP
jgi:2TM domain